MQPFAGILPESGVGLQGRPILTITGGIGGAVVSGDNWLERQQETHLKAKVSKRLSSVFRLDMGIESYIRNYRNHYLLCGADDSNRMSPTIGAGFFSMAYYPMEQ